MFSFPILMTLKIWLIFHIVSSFMLFCLTLYLTQLLNSERYEKIQQEDVAVVKQQNFKFMGLPVFVISCSLYLYYIPDFFYFNQNHIISTLAFFVSCCSFYLVFAYMGTQFLDPKLIDFDVERIEKKRRNSWHWNATRCSENWGNWNATVNLFRGGRHYELQMKIEAL